MPAVHSVWWRLIASMPSSASSWACRSSGTSIDRLLVECTSFTDAVVAERAELGHVRRAHPQPFAGVVAPGDVDQRVRGRLLLHVHREFVGGPELGVDVGEPRGRPASPASPRGSREMRYRRSPARNGGVVGADDLAVGTQPDVGFEAGRTELERPPERGERVLRCFLLCTAVGKRDHGQDSRSLASRDGRRGGHRATDGGEPESQAGESGCRRVWQPTGNGGRAEKRQTGTGER